LAERTRGFGSDWRHSSAIGHAGSDRGGQRAAFIYSLIVSAKLNTIDPQAWLADVRARIAEILQQRLAELLPWNWQPQDSSKLTAQAA